MADPTQGPTQSVLQSEWAGLNSKLIACIYPIQSKLTNGIRTYQRDPEQPNAVKAPVKGDGQMNITGNWASPFEGQDVENKRPMLMGMLQSGAIQPVLDAASNLVGGNDSVAKQKAMDTLEKMEGRASITKLNSTQIFNGMPPIKFPVTLIFRAYSDPHREVTLPIKQLLKWSVPKILSPDGRLVGLIKGNTDNAAGASSTDQADAQGVIDKGIEAAFPSRAPQVIAYQYGNETWLPMVIEEVSKPSSYPMDGNGDAIYMEVNLTLSSLTALDATDIDQLYEARGF
jgi:hypothetical protein